VLIFTCVLISLYFLLTRGSKVNLKFTSEKIVQLKNVQHVPTIRKNLVSVFLLLRDGFKVVLESNKLVISKHG
jgi:hypothetical protein